jgi:hypothetical protein
MEDSGEEGFQPAGPADQVMDGAGPGQAELIRHAINGRQCIGTQDGENSS